MKDESGKSGWTPMHVRVLTFRTRYKFTATTYVVSIPLCCNNLNKKIDFFLLCIHKIIKLAAIL